MFVNKSKGHLLKFFLFFMLISFLFMISCSQTPEPKKNTNKALLEALGEHTQRLILGSSDGSQLIITPELSARVLGASFDGENGENLMWVADTLFTEAYWAKKPYFWNAGGYRTWIAPEDLFFLDEDNEWFVPSSLDPASYRVIEQNNYSATFETDINLTTNIGKYYVITVKRHISLITESPSDIAPLPQGVKYVGIGLTHSLTNQSEEVIGVDLPYVCLWNLLQINPSGTTLVPLVEGSDLRTAYREYFEPLGDRLTVSNDIISVKIDGEYRSKIGVRPEVSKTGMAFLRDNQDNTGVLYVMLFPVDPDGIYVDKPWGTESDYGDAIELYNDDGNMGGFTELECHGPAKKLERGETQSHKTTLHIFSGSIPELKKIGSVLLDTDLTKAAYF